MRNAFVVLICFSLLVLMTSCGGSSGGDDSGSSGGNGNASPVARITSPAEGSVFTVGEVIPFVGSCSDSEDGALTGASLVWTSDRDGQIDTGETCSSTTLSVGAHHITLTATDSGGAEGMDTVAITVNAVAASCNLPETGQQDCFDALGAGISCTATGQDGDIRAGAAWPNPRFTDLGDGSLLDELTGLIWLADGNIMPTRDPGYDTEGDPDNGVVSWQTALDYIQKLNDESYLGFQDWRLPNRNELISLAHFNDASCTTRLQAAGFTNYSAYWSSTTQEAAGEFAWSFNVINGYWSIARKTENHRLAPHLVAVRTGNSIAPARVAATGQTTCFDRSGISIACAGTGQDGELQVGVGMPNPRFIANADTSITDQMTGLIWESDPNVMLSRDPSFDPTPIGAGAVTWQLALDYIDHLNSENHLGHSDWRMPNVLELLSLFNGGEPSNAAWLSANGFGALPFAHWSSTTNMGMGEDLAWGVQLFSGLSANQFKTAADSFYVWPVRGGN